MLKKIKYALVSMLGGALIAGLLLGASWACKDSEDEEARTYASVVSLGQEAAPAGNSQ